MNTPFDFGDTHERTVYIKSVAVEDLPDEVKDQIDDREQLYAVHAADGQQLALVADRRMAFVLARQNDYAPVAVH